MNEKSQDIQLTKRAAHQAQHLRDHTAQYYGKSLRLYLEGKGCDGFYYGVAFDEPSNTDHHFWHGDLDLIVDSDTLQFVKGSTIDWVDDERGQGFLVDNPNQRKFRGKFYKREAWRKRLSAQKMQSSNL